MPVGALMLFGGETLKDFAFALLVGVASGAYSSIFIATPVLVEWKEREPVYMRRRRLVMEEHGGLVPAFATGAIAAEPAVAAGDRGAGADAPRPPRRRATAAPPPARRRRGAAPASAPPPPPPPAGGAAAAAPVEAGPPSRQRAAAAEAEAAAERRSRRPRSSRAARRVQSRTTGADGAADARAAADARPATARATARRRRPAALAHVIDKPSSKPKRSAAEEARDGRR